MFITKGPLSNRPFIVSSNVSINYILFSSQCYDDFGIASINYP